MSTRARRQTWNSYGAAPTTLNAIEFPTNNNAGPGPTLFNFTGSNAIQAAPATYIWRAYFHQQAGYYTTFFYDTDITGGYVGDSSYFGCHPYPYTTGVGATGSSGTVHHFEISAEGTDTPITKSGLDDNGNSTLVTKERWYKQACRVTSVGGKPLVEFFWDLDAGTNYLISYQFASTMTAGSANGNAWGASPWPTPSDFRTIETMYGRLRCLQQYAGALSTANIVSAVNCESNSAVSLLGLPNPWYWNVNLTPSDIADKSGQGHHPAWINGSFTGTLWTGP